MGVRILGIGIVHIVRGHQPDAGLPAHPHQLRIDHALRGNAVVLELQKIVPFTEDPLVLESRAFRLLIEAPGEKLLHLARQAGAGRNDPLMIFLKDLPVHAGTVIEAVHETRRDDLHQVSIALIILRKQDEMIIAVLIVSPAGLPVKARSRGDVDLTAQDRLDPGRSRCLIKIDDPVHHPVVGDGRAVHPQLRHALHILLDLVGSVQQTVFGMDVKVCKFYIFWCIHPCFLLLSCRGCRNAPPLR